MMKKEAYLYLDFRLRKLDLAVALAVIISALLLVVLLAGCSKDIAPEKQPQTPTVEVCTAEAKVCPDGTTVGRTGKNCEFAPCPTQESSQPNEVRGVYAVIEWNQNPSDEVLNNKNVDGLVIRTYWKDVNPEQEIYNWTYLDHMFEEASKHHKKIHLIIVPGFYSPQWVLDNVTIKKAEFQVLFGPFKDETRLLPLPWDDAYLSAWFKFIDAVDARYGRHPNLGYISATGPNAYNGEMRLPRKQQDEIIWLSLASGTNLDEKKRSLENMLTGAWEKTIEHFCDKSSEKHFTIALVDHSIPLGDETVQQEFKQELVDYGTKQCPKTFGIQTNGLDGRPINPDEEPISHWKLIKDYAGIILTGFQTKSPLEMYVPGNPDLNVKILRQAVENAITRKAHFIEFYESDILDQSKKDVINYAHAAIRN